MTRWFRSFDWWGNALYLVGSIGYAFLDFVSGYASGNPFPSFMDYEVTKLLWVVMASIFLIDAFLYWFAWIVEIFFESRAWGEIYNVVSSVGWVVVAGLAYSINTTSTPGEKLSYWVKYAIACLISSVLMFESTLHWLTGWRTERNEELKVKSRWSSPMLFGFVTELGFWAEFFDCVGSILYMIGSFVLIFNFFTHITALTVSSNADTTLASIVASVFSDPNSSTAPIAAPRSEFDASFTLTDSTSCRWFFFGDVTYALDSILYIILWYRTCDDEIDVAPANDVDLGVGDKYLPIEDHNLELQRKR